MLWSRCLKSNDLKTDEAIVEKVANEIEESLFAFFKKDVGFKNQNKYRTLLFNIKDERNLELFYDVISKRISPGKINHFWLILFIFMTFL